MDDLISPASELRPFVEGYWLRSGVYEPVRKVRVLADACAKLIFELAPMPWGSCYLIGTQVSPIIVALAGRVERIGIRFRPGTASFFLRHSLDGLSGGLTPAGRLGIEDADAVLARLRQAETGEARGAILDAWLLARLPVEEAELRELDAVREVGRLLRTGLAPPAVAAAMQWPERRLQRVCRNRFGAPAAKLHRLYRFELLHARLRGQPVDLARLAAELGFSDQSHMARDFRHFAQTTISSFVRERAAAGNLQDAGGWLPVLRDLQEVI